jgi:hypothetical protein
MENNVAMTPKQALDFIGGLSEPSKMPCFGFSIPAWLCKTGAKLRNAENTVCSKCYALKGRYAFPNVKNALLRRFNGIKKKLWVDAMVVAISSHEASGFFRWHDSGDIQSVAHLKKICEIAKRLPNVKFWLPTREYSFVSKYVKQYGPIPDNLTIRLSALLVNGQPPVSIAKRLNCVTSGVSDTGFTCPSSTQGNKCLTCRACWDKNVANVNYKTH